MPQLSEAYARGRCGFENGFYSSFHVLFIGKLIRSFDQTTLDFLISSHLTVGTQFKAISHFRDSSSDLSLEPCSFSILFLAVIRTRRKSFSYASFLKQNSCNDEVIHLSALKRPCKEQLGNVSQLVRSKNKATREERKKSDYRLFGCRRRKRVFTQSMRLSASNRRTMTSR